MWNSTSAAWLTVLGWSILEGWEENVLELLQTKELMRIELFLLYKVTGNEVLQEKKINTLVLAADKTLIGLSRILKLWEGWHLSNMQIQMAKCDTQI